MSSRYSEFVAKTFKRSEILFPDPLYGRQLTAWDRNPGAFAFFSFLYYVLRQIVCREPNPELL
jgi:hypothetical protein